MEESLAKAEGLGGTRIMGPERITDELEIGMAGDPEGHVIGVMRNAA